jgi:hypothetical protein
MKLSTISLLAFFLALAESKSGTDPSYCSSCPEVGARQCGTYFVEECQVFGVALCWETVENCKRLEKCELLLKIWRAGMGGALLGWMIDGVIRRFEEEGRAGMY